MMVMIMMTKMMKKKMMISDVHCGLDVDIQEFYDTTLLDESKSVQQKTTETLQIVAKWEQTLTIAGGIPQQTTLQTEVLYCTHTSVTSRLQFALIKNRTTAATSAKAKYAFNYEQ